MSIKWNEKVCSICGAGSKVFIVILLDLPDPQLPPADAYSEMALCVKHWRELGLQPAVEMNRELRACAGIEDWEN